MGQRIDSRAVGLDTGLALMRWLTGAENLHYGDWTGLTVAAGNLRQAQEAYTDRLVGLLPPGALRILDIGGGAGQTAQRLIGLGHRVEIVIPSAFLAARCRVNAPEAKVHECRFEEFTGTGPFDLCLFSESFQYVPLEDGLPRCARLLAPGGRVLIADCFRTPAYRGRSVDGPKPGGGHPEDAFRAALSRGGWQVLHDEDITDRVAPSIDLEQELFNVLGTGITRLRDELAVKRPLALRLARVLGGLVLGRRRRDNLMVRLTGRTRTADAFRTYNRYRVMLLVPLAQGADAPHIGAVS